MDVLFYTIKTYMFIYSLSYLKKNFTLYPYRQAQVSVSTNPLVVITQVLQLITVKDLGKLFPKATEIWV